MRLWNRIVIAVSRVAQWSIEFLRLGAGSTWPGHIALYLNPRFIRETLGGSDIKVILIAGTNGKTTTAKLIQHILQKNQVPAFINSEGANLKNGLATSITRSIKHDGTFDYKACILEVDENVLPLVLDEITVHTIVLLNLFRDQLDRYGEIESILSKWKEALSKLNKDTNLIVNADDPKLYYLAKRHHAVTQTFAIDKHALTKSTLGHDVDSTYCPSCGQKLRYHKVAYSHLGTYVCGACGFGNLNKKRPISKLMYPLAGTYNIYNTNAAIAAAATIIQLDKQKLNSYLSGFTPTYGRQEKLQYKGRTILLILSKNPTGFNQSIQIAKDKLTKKGSILILLNDRIPDGRDVSWIWDVEFEELSDTKGTLYVSGDRAYDMSLRLKYGGAMESHLATYSKVSDALAACVSGTPLGADIVVLATYSAMLDVRKLLTGRKIL